MTYNAKATAFYKAAERIQNTANTILSDLEEKLIQRHTEVEHDPILEDSNPTSSKAEPILGNLEPPLSLLNLLSLEDTVKDDTDLILSAPPLNSLFNYEFPVFKPPPPPPPPKPRKPTRAEILKAKRRERQAELDAGPGFREPRTRHARAQAAAFEAEVGSSTSAPAAIADTPPPDQTEGDSEGSKKRKKPKAVLPGQSEEVPMVEDVGDQDSFKMFNAGWVLPPERRRGNRPPIEKRPVPPPRKRQRSGMIFLLQCGRTS